MLTSLVLADDFATGMLGATIAFLAVNFYADRRFGPFATAREARRDVLRQLGDRSD